MTHHTISARCDRCGTTIALNPIQLVTHPLCIPAGHAWANFVRAHMKCGNTETTAVAPNAPTPAVVRPDVISAPQPLLPGGPEQAPHLRIVGPNSGQQPQPMVTNHQQPIAAYTPPNIVTHAPSPSSAGPAGGQQGIAKQSATIFMPDGSSYDATQPAPVPTSTPNGTPGPAVQPVVATPQHRIVGPYEWGPLEAADLSEPDEHGVFTLTIESTLMVERTEPRVTAASTNDRALQVGSDPKRYTLQFTPGKASLTSPGTKVLHIVGRRLLKYNGEPWVDLPPPQVSAVAPPAMPSTLLASSKAPPAAPPPSAPEPATEPELEAPTPPAVPDLELEAPPASLAKPVLETTAEVAP